MGTTERKTSTARNRRFRNRVQELGYRRLEIVTGVQSIADLRSVAKALNMPSYEAFEQAVKLLVDWHKSSITGNGR